MRRKEMQKSALLGKEEMASEKQILGEERDKKLFSPQDVRRNKTIQSCSWVQQGFSVGISEAWQDRNGHHTLFWGVERFCQLGPRSLLQSTLSSRTISRAEVAAHSKNMRSLHRHTNNHAHCVL